MSQTMRRFWLGYALLASGLAGLIWLNPNHFTTVDSGYYLQSATNLLAGRGYVVRDAGRFVWNGTFPIGYPVLIAFVAKLTGLSVLWASKWVNYTVVGVSAWLWIRRLGAERAIWPLSVWALGGFLRIGVHTWSETVFLVGLAEWVWCLRGLLQSPTNRRALTLLALGYGLFLTRYVGGCVFSLTALLAGAMGTRPVWVQQLLTVPVTRPAAVRLRWATVAGVVLVGAYLGMNYVRSGTALGGERFVPTEDAGTLLMVFGRAVMNELLLIRDFVPGQCNGLAWFGLVFQTIWLALLYRRVRSWPPLYKPTEPDADRLLHRLLVLTGLTYVAVLFALRTVSPFDPPDARLMAPATYCLLWAVLQRGATLPTAWQRAFRPYWLVLLLASGLQLLPQADLSRKLAQVIPLLGR